MYKACAGAKLDSFGGVLATFSPLLRLLEGMALGSGGVWRPGENTELILIRWGAGPYKHGLPAGACFRLPRDSLGFLEFQLRVLGRVLLTRGTQSVCENNPAVQNHGMSLARQTSCLSN